MIAGRASFVVLVGAVAVAPWVTTPMTISATYIVAAVLFVGVGLWTTSLILARSWPHVPTTLLVLGALVLAYGWLMTLNGLEVPDLEPRGFPGGNFVDWLPGAVDRRVAFEAMVPLTSLLLAGAALVDHCRTRRARIAVLAAITASAAMMSVVATVDRLTDWSWPFTGDPRFAGGTRFVSFGYHGNAAAFLELGLPAAILLAITIRPRSTALRLAVLVAPAVILVGAAVNVSKLGQLLALLLVVVGAAVAMRGRRTATSIDRRRFAAFVFVGLCIVGVGAFAARDRWQHLPDGLGRDSGRALTWEVAARTAGRSPVFGTGPGGFKLYLQPVAANEVPELFRRSIVTSYRDGQPVSMWMQVHDDPLQTVAEWGPIATGALAVVVLWPLAKCAVVALRSRGRAVGPTVAALALTAVYAHSLVDFPLQVLPLQLTVAAWAAVALGEADVATAHASLVSGD